MKLLFFLASTAVGGGTKVLFQWINHLAARGETVEVISFHRHPEWYPLHVPVMEVEFPQAILQEKTFDFVIASNTALIPMVLPYLDQARPILVSQGFESYCYGNSYAELMTPCPEFLAIDQLPFPIITTSRSVQAIYRQFDIETFYVPCALDKALFPPSPRPVASTPKRILMVGNYLTPLKGMEDGFQALRLLSEEEPVELVLMTQESHKQKQLQALPFRVEIHYRPSQQELAKIMASCHVYCCPSWYEGLGLPALEAFSCGVPVVSTRHPGVVEYGHDGENCLLAEPNNPEDLYLKLKAVLENDALSERLREGGFRSVQERYEWNTAIDALQSLLKSLLSEPWNPIPIDEKQATAMLLTLEQQGRYTPVAVEKALNRSEKTLEALLTIIQAVQHISQEDLAEISSIQKELQGLLAYPKAEYYKAAKAQWDLCGFLVHFREDSRFILSLEAFLKKVSR